MVTTSARERVSTARERLITILAIAAAIFVAQLVLEVSVTASGVRDERAPA